jgi:hypothetical protein
MRHLFKIAASAILAFWVMAMLTFVLTIVSN